VTVDDVTGVVSRIRIRATSITNWDRKEYVVPNKEFITGRLLNWTLSDKVNRVVVEVGLAYGSDTEKARELLLKVANAHPLVMKDPAAMASFEGFGDNSLNLVLRTFLPSLENRLQVIHELHTAIDQEFRKAGIEIAFPQRDLHIRTFVGAPALGLQSSGDQESDSLRDVA
jgi:potassium efflux system protein